MYEDAMQGIHDNLVQKTVTKKMTYIAELLPAGVARGSWCALPSYTVGQAEYPGLM